MKISELKCWPGYKRVKGSCTKAEGYDPAASNRSAATLGLDNPLSPIGSISNPQSKR